MSFEFEKEDIVISQENNVEVELPTSEDIETTNTVEVGAKIDKWTIVGDDIYIANRTGTLPTWLQDTLDNYITYNSSLSTDVNDLNNLFTNFETGYNQEIGLVKNDITTLSYNLTNNYVKNDTYNSGIQNLEITKVDADGASAVARNVIGSWSIDPTGGGAWFDSKIQTVVNNQTSQAQSINSLSTQFNNVSVSIQDTNEVVAGYFSEYVSGEPKLGQFKFINNIQYQYLGGSLGELGDGWVRTDAAASSEGEYWAANSSKLIQGSDGSITGWEMADGSNTQSQFNIYSDNFKISDGTNSANVPFEVVVGTPNKVKFNGIVEFSNIDGVPEVEVPTKTSELINDSDFQTSTQVGTQISNTIGLTNDEFAQNLGYIDYNDMQLKASQGKTVISGGLINTTLINTDTLITKHIQVNTNGFVLNDTAAGTSADPNIAGAYIKGSTIEGSTIAVRDLTVLTDDGKTTKAAFGIVTTPYRKSVSPYTFTYPTGIYAYNSTTAPGDNRLAKATNNYIRGISPNFRLDLSNPGGWDLRFRMYRGTTKLYEVTVTPITWTSNTIKYYTLFNQYDLQIYLKQTWLGVSSNAYFDIITIGDFCFFPLSGEGELRIEIDTIKTGTTGWDGMGIPTAYNNAYISVSNL